MILNCYNISKAFGTNEILKNASFHIEEREKAALIGPNGAGKSTFLKIIMNQMSPDEGEITLSRDKTIGYLAQHQELDVDGTIFDELMKAKAGILEMEQKIRKLELDMKVLEGNALESAMASYSRLTHEFDLQNGYAYKSEVTGVLKGLGFDESEFDKAINTLSGGQKTRVALGKLLLTNPDIILLDEPTNHLDMDSIAWLETYLMNYKGAVLIVSHDRYFLDKVVTKIIEIDQGHVRMFAGNYSDYSQKKAALRQAAYSAYLNQQKEIRHQEEVIAKLKSLNRENSI